MGNPTGFIQITRKSAGYRPLNERIYDFGEVEQTLNEQDRRDQASRCMDCGVPFCQWGCPLMNIMPEWQDALNKGEWKKAIDMLHVTNNFPEFTGRICPAPCEHACTLNIHNEPVTIRENEAAVAEKGFEMGFILPHAPVRRTGKKIAIVGSGPAGLACADLLNRWGHTVTVLEKNELPGGLLRYGIPDFKLNKKIIDRRLSLLEQEGVIFMNNIHVGYDIKGKELMDEFDAICLTIGAMKARELHVEGKDLEGIYQAMDFLTQQNRMLQGISVPDRKHIHAKDKNVVVIGGGDTGSDCVGTAVRQGAKSIMQIEILPKPPDQRNPDNPWPYWANTLRNSSSHEEGCERKWSLNTKRFLGKNNRVSALEVTEVEWLKENGTVQIVEKKGSETILQADLVLLAMGFLHCAHEGIVGEWELATDARGNIKIDSAYRTNRRKVFSAGDAATGASLVVRAINQGRGMAASVHGFVTGPMP